MEVGTLLEMLPQEVGGFTPRVIVSNSGVIQSWMVHNARARCAGPETRSSLFAWFNLAE
jgi:hypothetical protein